MKKAVPFLEMYNRE